MTKMTIYDVIIDDGDIAFKTFVPAESEDAARDYVQGNGEIVSVKPSKYEYIDTDHLSDVLENASYSRAEIQIITRLIDICGLGN